MSGIGLRYRDRWQLLQIRLRIILGALLLLGAGPIAAAAQSGSNTPSIIVPTEIRVPPASVTRLQIAVNMPRGASGETMLVFRGLPPRVMLSEGRRFSAGVWAVPLASIGKLEIAPATGTSGTSELAIELTSFDGKVLAAAKTVLLIEPLASEQTKAVASVSQDEAIVRTTGTISGGSQPTAERDRPTLSTVRRLTAEEAKHARKLMERGDESLAGGKVTAARLLYQAAAEAGWAPAALALAQTYDSRVLKQSKVLGGVQPDPVLAKKWYEKAVELGSPEANSWLQALGAR